MDKKLTVVITSGISADYYEVNGESYDIRGTYSLESAIESGELILADFNEITFKRGRNVFAGGLVDNRLFNHMVSNFWMWVAQYQNQK